MGSTRSHAGLRTSKNPAGGGAFGQSAQQSQKNGGGRATLNFCTCHRVLNVGLKGGSVARCEHIRAIDKSRLTDKIGAISVADLEKIEEGITRILGIRR